jgi:hypothetical protein
MDTNFVIFVIIGTLFVVAIYSSSVSIVTADWTECTYNKAKTKSTCTVVNTKDPGPDTTWTCTKNKDGKTWSCVQALKTGGSTNIPSALKNGLAKAQADITTGASKNTSVLDRSLEKGGAFLKDGGNTVSNNNTITDSNNTLQ